MKSKKAQLPVPTASIPLSRSLSNVRSRRVPSLTEAVRNVEQEELARFRPGDLVVAKKGYDNSILMQEPIPIDRRGFAVCRLSLESMWMVREAFWDDRSCLLWARLGPVGDPADPRRSGWIAQPHSFLKVVCRA